MPARLILLSPAAIVHSGPRSASMESIVQMAMVHAARSRNVDVAACYKRLPPFCLEAY